MSVNFEPKLILSFSLAEIIGAGTLPPSKLDELDLVRAYATMAPKTQQLSGSEVGPSSTDYFSSLVTDLPKLLKEALECITIIL